MSEQKIVVPEGMFNAYMEALCIRWNYMKEDWPSVFSSNRENVLVALGAALQWLSENPIVPNQEEQFALHDAWSESSKPKSTAGGEGASQILFSIIEWQRRMFFALGSKIPADIKDLIRSESDGSQGSFIHNKAVLEAFRRGQESTRPPKPKPNESLIETYLRLNPEARKK